MAGGGQGGGGSGVEPIIWRFAVIIGCIIAAAYINVKAIKMGQPILGLFAIVAIGLGVATIAKPKILLFWVLCYYVVDPIVGSVKPGAAQVGTLTLLILLGVVLLQGALGGRRERRFKSLDWLVILLFISFVAAYRSRFGVTIWLYGFKQEAKYLLLFFLLRFMDFNLVDIRNLVRTVIVLGLIIGSYAIVQYFFDYGRLLPFVRATNFMETYGGESNNLLMVKRAYSLLLSPLNLGYAMMLGSLLAIPYAVHLKKEEVFERRAAWLAGLIMIGALVLSFTRTAWGGFALGMGLMFLVPRMRKSVFILGLLALAALPLVIVFRPELWSDFLVRFSGIFAKGGRASGYHYLFMKYSWDFIVHHPLGIGLGTATHSAGYFFSTALWTESEILNKGVQVGWFGLFSFVLLLLVMTIKAWKVAKTTEIPLLRGLAVYVFTSAPACFLAGLAGYVWASWVAASWFWILSAILFTYIDSGGEAPVDPSLATDVPPPPLIRSGNQRLLEQV